MLKIYVQDSKHIIDYSTLKITNNLAYEEKSLAILERKVHRLRSKDTIMIKVQLNRHSEKEATWSVKQRCAPSMQIYLLMVHNKFRG